MQNTDVERSLALLAEVSAGFRERYEVEGVLGQGAYGVVVRAIDRQLRRAVAVKFLKSKAVSRADLAARFRREARLMAALEHPNIVRLFDTELEGPAPYLVMEYVDGQTLGDRLEAGPLAAADALRIAAGILAGLEAAHRAGIVHRDLKPSNVLLDAAGTPRITDFGLAWADPDGLAVSGGRSPLPEPTMTAEGAILGTFYFIAPEVLRRQRATAASDLYATGVILHRMLYGELPYSPESLVAALEGRELVPAIPTPVTGVAAAALAALRASLSPDPSLRPGSAAAFASALEPGSAVAESEPDEKPDATPRGALSRRRRAVPGRGQPPLAGGLGSSEAGRRVVSQQPPRSGPPGERTRPAWPIRTLLAAALLAWVCAIFACWKWLSPPGTSSAAVGGKLPLPGAVSAAGGRPRLPWLRIAVGTDRLAVAWRTDTALRSRLRFRPAGQGEYRELAGKSHPTLEHALTVAGLPPGHAHELQLETGPGSWTAAAGASTLGLEPGCRAAVLADHVQEDDELSAVAAGQEVWLLSTTDDHTAVRLFGSNDDGLTWFEGLSLVGSPQPPGMSALAASQTGVTMLWLDPAGPPSQLRHTPLRPEIGATGTAPGTLALPGRLTHPPGPVEPARDAPELLLSCASGDGETVDLLLARPAPTEDGPWHLEPLGRLDGFPRLLAGAMREGRTIHVAWARKDGPQTEQVMVESLLQGSPSARADRVIVGRRVIGGSARFAAGEASGGLGLFYQIPPGGEETGAAPGDSRGAGGSAVFDDSRQLAEGSLLAFRAGRGKVHPMPPISFPGAVGTNFGLSTDPAGFSLVWGEMDLLSGPGFALNWRRFDAASEVWGPVRHITPNPYGIAAVTQACTGRTLHVFVLTTFSRRILYWRLGLSEEPR